MRWGWASVLEDEKIPGEGRSVVVLAEYTEKTMNVIAEPGTVAGRRRRREKEKR